MAFVSPLLVCCRLVTDESIDSMRTDVGAEWEPDNHRLYLQAELISPVLKGKQGLLEVARTLSVLNTLPIECNWSTELHVHVGKVWQCPMPTVSSGVISYKDSPPLANLPLAQ
jgi:hypothetical protein